MMVAHKSCQTSFYYTLCLSEFGFPWGVNHKKVDKCQSAYFIAYICPVSKILNDCFIARADGTM